MPAISTGLLFLIGGLAGLTAVLIAAFLVHRYLHRAEQRLREQIWREYR